MKRTKWSALKCDFDGTKQQRQTVHEICRSAKKILHEVRLFERSHHGGSQQRQGVPMNIGRLSRIIDNMNAVFENYNNLVGSIVYDYDGDDAEQLIKDFQNDREQIYEYLSVEKTDMTDSHNKQLAAPSYLNEVRKILMYVHNTLRDAVDHDGSFEDGVLTYIRIHSGWLPEKESAPSTSPSAGLAGQGPVGQGPRDDVSREDPLEADDDMPEDDDAGDDAEDVTMDDVEMDGETQQLVQRALDG